MAEASRRVHELSFKSNLGSPCPAASTWIAKYLYCHSPPALHLPFPRVATQPCPGPHMQPCGRTAAPPVTRHPPHPHTCVAIIWLVAEKTEMNTNALAIMTPGMVRPVVQEMALAFCAAQQRYNDARGASQTRGKGQGATTGAREDRG